MSWQVWTEAVSKKGPEAYENFFNCIKERNNADTNVSSKPYMLYLDPMGYCNLKCPFCSTGNESLLRDKKILSLSTFKHIIDHLGPYLFKIFLYNWGEPLLNKELPQMVVYAKKHHVVTEISTNLSFPISEDYAEEIVSSGLDFILCSIDGASQETYQKYRVSGNYELAMKNMELLNNIRKKKHLKTPVLLWRFLVFRHNQHEIEIARKKAKKLGVQITFLKPYVSPTHPEWSSTIPQFSSVNEIVPKIDEVKSDYSKTLTVTSKNKNEEDEFSIKNCQFSTNTVDKPKPCTWLWSSIVINASGSVSPCCAIESQQDDFGFVEDKIETVWNNQKYQSARDIFGQNQKKGNTICHKCPVPHIQQEQIEHDVQIITFLLGDSPPQKRSQILSRLKSSDENLYLKAVEICKKNGYDTSI